MRVVTLMVLGLLASAALHAHRARAEITVPPTARVLPSPNIVLADYRCGPGRHWVRRHHNHAGYLVHGHCRRNHRY
jgi:hypothetical protein